MDTLLPTSEGLDEGWLEKQRNLGRMNEHKTIVVDSIKGREKLSQMDQEENYANSCIWATPLDKVLYRRGLGLTTRWLQHVDVII